MLGPPDMCLITNRNVKQTLTFTKTAKPSTNYNETFSICFLLRKASPGLRCKNKGPEGDSCPGPIPETRLLCQPNKIIG